MKKIKIGNKLIGDGEPTFIIAEIGSNFTNLEEAKKSIDSAKSCGADAVKFQTYKANNLVIKNIKFPKEAGGRVQHEVFEETELSLRDHEELFNYAKEKDIMVFSTPSHPKDVELLEKLGVNIYKIGSDDLTNLPLMKYVAKKGKPIIISTGMAKFEEVEEAVNTIKECGNEKIIVLQCVSNYPIKELKGVNLRVIDTYKKKLEVLSGYSDHTTTISIPIASVAIGADIVERHFTIDKNMSAPDAAHSANPEELKKIIEGIREVDKALGDGIKRPTDTEIDMRRDTRKSIVTIEEIKEGELITKNNIDIKRPGYGIKPKYFSKILGKKTKEKIDKDTVLKWNLLE